MPTIKAGDIKISYQLSSEGEPLLLIMGFGQTGAVWMTSLAERVRAANTEVVGPSWLLNQLVD